jgi:hypothetical protein
MKPIFFFNFNQNEMLSRMQHIDPLRFQLNWCPLPAVLRIRIHMFLGLPDPVPDPLVRCMDPDPDPALDQDPDPSIIMQK